MNNTKPHPTTEQEEYRLRNLSGFEGDNIMRRQFAAIFAKHRINLVIETGTYLGGTANQLRSMVKELITIEVNKEFYEEAKNNIGNHSNVTMLNMDSVKALSDILKTKAKKKNIFFFLDAHWYESCPLLEELGEIAMAGIKPVIAIHDFFVPGTNFGFDTYKGQRFDWEFVREAIEKIYGVDNFTYFYNQQAEGAQRGILYVEPK